MDLSKTSLEHKVGSKGSSKNCGFSDSKRSSKKIKKLNSERKTRKKKCKREASSTSSDSSSSSEEERRIRNRKRKKRRQSSSSSSSSTSSSSSSFSDSENEKQKKRERKKKKRDVKLVKEEKKKLLKKEVDNDDCDIPLDLMSKPMAPMSKEQWDKQQSVIRKVYDESSGRYRLIKGDGEVIEEMVSRERHKEINQQATRGDGNYFQASLQNKLGQ